MPSWVRIRIRILNADPDSQSCKSSLTLGELFFTKKENIFLIALAKEKRISVFDCDFTVQASVPDSDPNPDPPDPRVFGLPDPDPLVRGMDPDPALDQDPSIIMQK